MPIFIYESKGQYWFHEEGNPKNRFFLEADFLGEQGKFLKPDTKVATMVFNDKVIKVDIPIKMEFKVTEAPPAIRGNTAQGGTKSRDDRRRRESECPALRERRRNHPYQYADRGIRGTGVVSCRLHPTLPVIVLKW